MDCIDLTSKQSKMLRYVAKHSKQRKPTKVIKLYCIASIWRLKDQNFWVTSLNYKSNQITMDCIDLTSKQSKMLRYVAKHSKQRKPTKVIKLYCIASIWRLNDQNFWVTSLNYKSNQITMDCIDLTSKRSKTLRYGRKTFKTTQNYIRDQITINWHRFDVKTIKNIEVRSQNIQNNAKLQNWSNYNELLLFDVKSIKQLKTTNAIKLRSICIDLTSKRYKTLRYGRKTFKTTQNYKIDQSTKNCFYLMSKRSKQLKTTNAIKLRSICIDLTSKQSKMLRYVAKHSIQRKTTKVIKL